MLDPAIPKIQIPNQTIKIERNIMTTTNNETEFTFVDAYAWRKEVVEFNSLVEGDFSSLTPDQICSAFEASAFHDKESYLSWRDAYRAEIKRATEMRRKIKSELPDFRTIGKLQITRMIKIRKASKIAAGVQRKRSLAEAS